MNNDRKGICVAGNMVVDNLYPVRGLPSPGELTTILNNIQRSCGGALCNVIGDLARMDPSLQLTALGRVGSDAEGDYILETFRQYKNVIGIHVKLFEITVYFFFITRIHHIRK